MSDDAIIHIEGVWKRYGLPLPALYRNGRRWLRSLRSLRNGDDQRSSIGNPQADGGPWALRDINLEVRRGETLGIIGLNGAGKSTLLKVLAGVTPPTRGRVEVRGRGFSMIELNAGLHPELTGRENVRLLGAIMGLSRPEMEAKTPEIDAFCELGEWFDRPVRMYSSGMLARLGFGVAMHVNADVLLIDEVLAVGDFAFQKKCVGRMAQLSHGGATMLFVSHNPYMIERMCDRVALLHTGVMEELGKPADVIHRYFDLGMIQTRVVSTKEQRSAFLRPGTGDLRIQKVEILDGAGEPTTEILAGEPVTIRLCYETTEPLWETRFSIRIYDPQNTMVVAFDSTVARKGSEICGEGYVDCKVRNLPLMPNFYNLQIKVAGGVLLDMYDNAAAFIVRAHREVLENSGNKGIVYAKADWCYVQPAALVEKHSAN